MSDARTYYSDGRRYRACRWAMLNEERLEQWGDYPAPTAEGTREEMDRAVDTLIEYLVDKGVEI